jgi:hypothetical protein
MICAEVAVFTQFLKYGRRPVSSFLPLSGRKESGVGSNALCVKLLIVAFLWTSENQTL